MNKPDNAGACIKIIIDAVKIAGETPENSIGDGVQEEPVVQNTTRIVASHAQYGQIESLASGGQRYRHQENTKCVSFS